MMDSGIQQGLGWSLPATTGPATVGPLKHEGVPGRNRPRTLRKHKRWVGRSCEKLHPMHCPIFAPHLGVFLVVFRARGLTAGEPRTWQVQLMLALRGIFLYHYTQCVFEVYLYIHIYLPIYLFIYTSIYMSIYLFLRMCINVYVDT